MLRTVTPGQLNQSCSGCAYQWGCTMQWVVSTKLPNQLVQPQSVSDWQIGVLQKLAFKLISVYHHPSLIHQCRPSSTSHFFAFENRRHLYFSPLTVISRAPSWLSWFEAVPMRTLFSFSRFSLSIFSLASCLAISACRKRKQKRAMSNCGSQRSCQWWRGTRKKTKRKKSWMREFSRSSDSPMTMRRGIENVYITTHYLDRLSLFLSLHFT